jgi:hypothetical protein
MPRLSGLPLHALAVLVMAGGLVPAAATSLEAIHELEGLINASGTETAVAVSCPPNHAAYYENDGHGIDRLVLCRDTVDFAMQACHGPRPLPPGLPPPPPCRDVGPPSVAWRPLAASAPE